MKQRHKLMIWLPIAIIGIGIIAYSGIRVLVFVIVESNSCERFNIDNIETRIHIDIPSIESCSCMLDQAANTKTNYFKIRSDVDMERYVGQNSFRSVSEANLDYSVFGELVKVPETTPENLPNYYYNSGKGKRTDWLAIVDKNSGDLWVYMKYKK